MSLEAVMNMSPNVRDLVDVERLQKPLFDASQLDSQELLLAEGEVRIFLREEIIENNGRLIDFHVPWVLSVASIFPNGKGALDDIGVDKSLVETINHEKKSLFRRYAQTGDLELYLDSALCLRTLYPDIFFPQVNDEIQKNTTQILEKIIKERNNGSSMLPYASSLIYLLHQSKEIWRLREEAELDLETLTRNVFVGRDEVDSEHLTSTLETLSQMKIVLGEDFDDRYSLDRAWWNRAVDLVLHGDGSNLYNRAQNLLSLQILSSRSVSFKPGRIEFLRDNPVLPEYPLGLPETRRFA